MSTGPVPTVVAVDWSGARDPSGQREHVWIAVVERGRLVELSAGRTRAEAFAHIVELAERDASPDGDGRDGPGGSPATVVGLDFSFGFPEWFARAHGCRDGPGAWLLATREGERWLHDCPPPFFGQRGTRRPPGTELFRATEHDVRRATGLQPKSIFQIAGPGAVGVGSLRGMPFLTRARERGWAVWPFDPVGRCTVLELYPALAVGRSAGVATPGGRRRFLDARRPGTTSAWPAAVESRDAFDAVVAAYLLADHLTAGAHGDDWPVGEGETARIEGAIWQPDAP